MNRRLNVIALVSMLLLALPAGARCRPMQLAGPGTGAEALVARYAGTAGAALGDTTGVSSIALDIESHTGQKPGVWNRSVGILSAAFGPFSYSGRATVLVLHGATRGSNVVSIQSDDPSPLPFLPSAHMRMSGSIGPEGTLLLEADGVWRVSPALVFPFRAPAVSLSLTEGTGLAPQPDLTGTYQGTGTRTYPGSTVPDSVPFHVRVFEEGAGEERNLYGQVIVNIRNFGAEPLRFDPHYALQGRLGRLLGGPFGWSVSLAFNTRNGKWDFRFEVRNSYIVRGDADRT